MKSNPHLPPALGFPLRLEQRPALSPRLAPALRLQGMAGMLAGIPHHPWCLPAQPGCQHRVPSPQGGIGAGAARGWGLEGSRRGWHGAGLQDRGSSGKASAAGASSGEPRQSQDAAGHGDLERHLPWDGEVITHT